MLQEIQLLAKTPDASSGAVVQPCLQGTLEVWQVPKRSLHVLQAVYLHFLDSCGLGASRGDRIHLPARYRPLAVTAAPRPATRMMCLDRCFPPGCRIRGICSSYQRCPDVLLGLSETQLYAVIARHASTAVSEELAPNPPSVTVHMLHVLPLVMLKLDMQQTGESSPSLSPTTPVTCHAISRCISRRRSGAACCSSREHKASSTDC